MGEWVEIRKSDSVENELKFFSVGLIIKIYVFMRIRVFFWKWDFLISWGSHLRFKLAEIIGLYFQLWSIHKKWISTNHQFTAAGSMAC